MTSLPLRISRWIVTLVICTAALAAAQVNVTTYHYDNSRTGQNIQETILNPGNVNVTQFGKLFSASGDGYVYAQPLYLANVQNIAGGTHNVLYVATEHDSLYALDADTGAVLWQISFINPSAGITTVPSADVACTDLVPELGITGTPVIDPATNTLYVVVRTKESGVYFQRLHAIDTVTSAEKFGGPVEIAATVNGTGAGGNGITVSFDPLQHNSRPGLLLENGHVVIAWASQCDNDPYHGWIMSYSASSLAQEAVFNTSPNGTEAGVWMSGDGLAADANGNIFVAIGNGSYDGPTDGDYGESILKLTGPSDSRLTVADWFTPYDQGSLSLSDTDVNSGGVLLLPDLPAGSAHTQLLVQMGKLGTIYLVDRNNMGQYCSNCSSDNQIVQEIPGATSGIWGSPAYWNGTVYWGAGNGDGPSDHLKAFSWNANNSGMLSTSPTSESSQWFSYAAAAPVISANGNSSGIMWILDNSNYLYDCCQVLYAYDATNLANVFYTSSQAANNRDQGGGPVKFTAPVVVNGKVYAGNQAGVTAWGLIGTPPAAAAPTFSPAPGTYTGAQSVTLKDSTSGAAIYYTTDGSTPTTASTPYNGAIPVSATTTVAAIAVAPGHSQSAIASGTYTITPPAATPTFSPAPGIYTSAQRVTLSDSTSGAIIYYTTDGSTPTTGSTQYSGAIPVSATAVIEAIAVASGYSQSVVSFGTYIIGSLPASMPLLIALSPGGAKIGGGSFMLTVNGANFVPGSMVRWNGAARTTTYMNGTQLQATILASDIAREGTGLVTVANPTPTAATSPAQPIAVVSGAPAANITSGSISDTADGSGNHTLTLTGTDFVSGSTVNWNGAGLLTTYVSPWQIGATLPAADSGSAATVTVVNPAPGGTSAGFVLP